MTTNNSGISRNITHRYARLSLIAFLMACMLTSTGCTSFQAHPPVQEKKPTVVTVENEFSKLTPTQRESRFREAYEGGLELVKRGEYGVALGAFEEAVTLKPNSAAALFNLGACHEALGDPVKAIPIYRNVLSLMPNDPDCYANLGTSYIKLYRLEKSPGWKNMARQNWNQSLKIDPNQPDIKGYLAELDSME